MCLVWNWPPELNTFFQFVHFLFLMIISETVAQNFFFAFPKFKLKAASSVESLVLKKKNWTSHNYKTVLASHFLPLVLDLSQEATDARRADLMKI